MTTLLRHPASFGLLVRRRSRPGLPLTGCACPAARSKCWQAHGTLWAHSALVHRFRIFTTTPFPPQPDPDYSPPHPYSGPWWLFAPEGRGPRRMSPLPRLASGGREEPCPGPGELTRRSQPRAVVMGNVGWNGPLDIPVQNLYSRYRPLPLLPWSHSGGSRSLT